MNDAHLHMTFNHFPIIGSIFGSGILLAGILLKNKSVQNTAFVLLFVSAVLTFFALRTGEGAEEIAENLGIDRHIIHEHEEIAEKYAILMYLTGAVAILALITSIRKHRKATVFAFVVLVLGIGAMVLSAKVGTSGGEIRHTEIRKDFVSEQHPE